MLKNNRWYKYKNGKSILFKEENSSGFGYTYAPFSKIDNWCKRKRVYFGENIWEEITSPKEVLKVINKGMKSIGYHNKVKLVPFFHIHKMRGSIITFVKLRDFHFDFNNEKSVDLLMNKGELWLTDNKADICILKNGRLAKIK